MSDLYVARQSGTVMLGGRRHAIRRGSTVAEEGSEMLRAHRRLFEPMRVHYPAGKGAMRPVTATRPPRPVEQATAAPGELREVAPAQELACDEPGCDATAKSPAGLAAHKRSHRSE